MAFPNYTQVRDYVPQPVWYFARLATVGLSFGIVLTLFVRPDVGLFVFWRLIIPVLPILFFIAPGLWRNICPMAAVNQTPRLFRFTRNIALPAKAKEYAYTIGIVLFFLIVPTRKVIFNSNGPALGVLLIIVYATAFAGGFLFKGKSGWCSSICPLLPVQRLYGQTPFVKIPNNHCKPCVGCAKNCYDFNPQVANMADQYDKDRQYSAYRRFFAGAFPGLILAFYIVPDAPKADPLTIYAEIGLLMLVSLGVFNFLETFLRFSSVQATTLFGLIAINLYYFFNVQVATDTIQKLFGLTVSVWLLAPLNVIVFGLSLLWLVRTYYKEPLFLAMSISQPTAVKPSKLMRNSMILHQSKVASNPEVAFEPQLKRVLVQPGTSILEVAEANGFNIEAGCRMGVCGADPVAILKGMENLSAANSDEKSTLDRLGFAENTRMACCARIDGAISVALKPEKPQAVRSSMIAGFKYDKAVQHVVVIGNGIAGITAADHIRRRHPLCDIHVVAREKYHLYNRMGLSRVIYGRSAMQGLFLMADSWYEDHQITTSLNTYAVDIDAEKREVELADGERLPYDRLVLATGSAATVPPIEGFGLPGTYVLRDADDATAIRAYAQLHRSHGAVIAGGGLLGLEAAYALHKIGLKVTVLERSKWPMRRQIDERGGYFLSQYLMGLGIEVVTEAEIATLTGDRRLRKAILKDDREFACDVFLICAGITPNVELAQKAGLEIKQGVIVDDHMRTSDPRIFAAGDVAEYEGRIYGLWPVAVEQAEVAAVNILGGEKTYSEIVPQTMLKVAGVDLMSIGQFDASSPDDIVIALEDTDQHRYRKLVISNGKIVGAILLGYPLEAPIVKAAIKDQKNVNNLIPALQAGNWNGLK